MSASNWGPQEYCWSGRICSPGLAGDLYLYIELGQPIIKNSFGRVFKRWFRIYKLCVNSVDLVKTQDISPLILLTFCSSKTGVRCCRQPLHDTTSRWYIGHLSPPWSRPHPSHTDIWSLGVHTEALHLLGNERSPIGALLSLSLSSPGQRTYQVRF